jgi:hypothetical protein
VVDALLVAETTQAVGAWSGRALVEVTDAGLRIVDLDKGMRQVLSLKPSVLQARSGAAVAVPLADVDSLDVETPTALANRLLSEHLDTFGNDPEIEKIREKFTNSTNSPCGIGVPCYPDPPPSDPGDIVPTGGPGGNARSCSQPCVRGRCSVTCYAGQSPICRCSSNGDPLCSCL